ncbi:aspartate aminotransferase family protein, partial [Candidatus Aerophobetes bacterium]|nr:aspartate aminotransferase family protein [Candidatus Aerophobetes bacterium]
GKILELARKKGLLINVTQKNTLRFLPPLIVTQKEMDRAVSILDEIFREVKT